MSSSPIAAARRRESEIMDQLNLEPARHRAALAGLARLNAWSGSARMLWPAIRQLIQERRIAEGKRNRKGEPDDPIRLLDVATGSGDVPTRVALRARRNRIPLEVTGIDRSPIALEKARQTALRHGVAARFLEYDVLGSLPAATFDVVTCSLFLHHLSEDEAITLLERLRQLASSLVLVCDLDRRAAGFLLTWAATRLLTRSDVVRFDGPASVLAAFTPEEVQRLAGKAGLAGATVRRRWPFRWLLEWRAPAP